MNIKKMAATLAAAGAIAVSAIAVGAPQAKAGDSEGPFSYCHLYYKGTRYPGIKVTSETYEGEAYLCVVNISPRPKRREWFSTYKVWFDEGGTTTRECDWQITTTGRGEGWCTVTSNYDEPID